MLRCRQTGTNFAFLAAGMARFLCALILVGAMPAAFAQTWNGGGGNDNWTTGANWVGGVAPTGVATDNLVFTGSTRPTPNNNFPAATNFGSITFDTNGFAVGGSSITLNGDLSALSGSNWITLPIVLGGTP